MNVEARLRVLSVMLSMIDAQLDGDCDVLNMTVTTAGPDRTVIQYMIGRQSPQVQRVILTERALAHLAEASAAVVDVTPPDDPSGLAGGS